MLASNYFKTPQHCAGCLCIAVVDPAEVFWGRVYGMVFLLACMVVKLTVPQIMLLSDSLVLIRN